MNVHRPIEAAVGEADRVVDHHPLDRLRILRRQARREHPAHRVADDHRPFDPFLLQDQEGVARLRVEVVRRNRLRRLAVADLIRDDDAEPFLGQRVDDRLEIEAAEVVAVQQHDGMAVGRALRRHVHVGDADVLRVDPDVEVLAGVGIGTLVAGDAARLDVGGRRRRRQDAALLRGQPGRAVDQQQSEGERREACMHGRLNLAHRCTRLARPGEKSSHRPPCARSRCP